MFMYEERIICFHILLLNQPEWRVSAGQNNVGSVVEYCSNCSEIHVKDRATKTRF